MQARSQALGAIASLWVPLHLLAFRFAPSVLKESDPSIVVVMLYGLHC